MYAIVDIAGQQFKVEKDQQVFVHRLEAEEGDKVEFDHVLLIDDKGKVNVGAPAIDGALVTAKVLRHLKGDKTIVFKKKRRKGYKKKQGHRQYFTEIQISDIAASGAKKSKATTKKKEEAPKKSEPKTTAKKAESTSKSTTAKKKADDFKKIEGIGPKTAEALVNAGITTYEDLAKTKAEKISEILTEASSRLAHLVTDTWPEQAKLAAAGKWDELKELQDKLDGGKA